MKNTFLLIALFVLSACSIQTETSIQPESPTTLPKSTIENSSTELSPGLTEIIHFFDDSESAFMYLLKIDQKKFKFSIKNEPQNPKTVSGWKEENKNAIAIINAAYFNEDFSPTGFIIENGIEESTSTFDYNRSGMITLSPNVDIIDTSTSNSFVEKNTTDALQSFPFLIKNNKSAISEDSGKTARRSFIAKDINQNIYIGIIPEYFVTLKETSSFLLQTNIEWESAINLDGGTSTGLASPNKVFNSYVSIPSVIMISEK